MDQAFCKKMDPGLHHPFSESVEFMVPGHRGKSSHVLSREEADYPSGEHEFQVASVAFGVSDTWGGKDKSTFL